MKGERANGTACRLARDTESVSWYTPTGGGAFPFGYGQENAFWRY